MSKPIALIGYSGHAYVVCDIFTMNGREVSAYIELTEKTYNPFQLDYLGSEKEKEVLQELKDFDYFISIGNNEIRKGVFEFLMNSQKENPINAIHPQAILSSTIKTGTNVFIGAGAILNAFVTLENGVICNSGCIIEHECEIGTFAHIAPGVILNGNVQVGEQSFIGAGSIVKEGVNIGKNVTIGAGSLILKDVPDETVIFGKH